MAVAAAGGDGGSGQQRWRQRSPEVAIEGVAAAAAGGDGGSGRQRCRRLAKAAVDGPVAMAAVMGAMNGCMRPANAATESSTARFVSAFESSVPGLGLGCLLRPLIFSLSLWRSLAMVVLINCSYTTRCRCSPDERKALIG